MKTFIHGYLRASTKEQDATRAKSVLQDFAGHHGLVVDKFYVENESGAKLNRPVLAELLSNLRKDDIILLEQIDRLSRLKPDEWRELKRTIEQKGAHIVSLDLPTSHMTLTANKSDKFMRGVLDAVNGMLLDILATTARKDYEDRRRRQAEGIAKAKAEGKFTGKRADPETSKKCAFAHELVTVNKKNLAEALIVAGVGRATYYRWKKLL
ncbi:recombinase family protein [Vibrio vulnificus]